MRTIVVLLLWLVCPFGLQLSAQEIGPFEAMPTSLENDYKTPMLPPPGTPSSATTGVVPKAVDENISTAIRLPCVCEYDPCSGDARLNVGDLWAIFYSNGSRQTQAHAYWNNNQCGSGDHACCIFGPGRNLVVTVDNAWIQNIGYGGVGSSAQFFVAVFEYNSICEANPQTPVRSLTDSDTCVLYDEDDLPSSYAIHAWADSGAACTSAYGDPDASGCNLPDVLISPPSQDGVYIAGTRCYDYYVWVRTCDSAGNNCNTMSAALGRFEINWLDPL